MSSACPHCGYRTNARMGIAMRGAETSRQPAGPGDISICIKCADLAIFTASMGQRKLTYLEELGLDAETKKLLKIARSQVRALPRQ